MPASPRTRRARRSARQQELVFRTWGGARLGAGRKPGPEGSGVPHRERPLLASRFPVHVTLKARAEAPPLRALRCRAVLRQALRRGGDKPAFRVCHFSIQNTHVHLLCEALDAQGLSRGLQGLAIRIAKQLNRALGRRGALWADRYHTRILKTPREVRGALVYVLNNSRHHRLAARGGSLPAHCVDPLSSAPYFDGWCERLRWAESGEPRPVAAPHGWLLARGWRRHGRISIAEGPAPPGA